MYGLGFENVSGGVLLTDDPYADLLASAQPGDMVPTGGYQPTGSGFSLSQWINRNKNAVYLGAAALVAMAMFGGGGGRRR